MQIKTDGIILRVQNIGDKDRLCTILTRNRGIIRAFARGANSIKNKNASATGLFVFAQFEIFRRKDTYIIDEIEIKDIFFSIREDIEKLTLAQYFCELAISFCINENEESSLRLILNCLHYLADSKRNDLQIKAIFELRMMEIHGYMPNMIMCENCGIYECDNMYFKINDGNLLCENCNKHSQGSFSVKLDLSAVYAVRHIIYSDFNKIFSFSIKGDSLNMLARASELYTLQHTSNKFTTLDFYKQLVKPY